MKEKRSAIGSDMGIDPVADASSADDTTAESEQPIRLYLQQHSDQLLGFIRAAVIKAGLTERESVESVAMEILNRTVVLALEKAHQFDSTRPAGPWLMGIANNVIKQYRGRAAKQAQREIPISHMKLTQTDDDFSDGLALFDRLAALNPHVFANIAQLDPEAMMVADEIDAAEQGQIRHAFARLSRDDQNVLRLSVINGMDGNALAQSLGIKPGAARVRLHRAIRRLGDLLSSAKG